MTEPGGHSHFSKQPAALIDLSSLRSAGFPHAMWLTFRRTHSSWSHDKGVPSKSGRAVDGLHPLSE